MAEPTSRKPIIVAVAGAVVLSTALYAYFHYSSHRSTASDHAGSLHRSNALRRPRHRRRWRRGVNPVMLDFDPTERALSHVDERNEHRQGYGEYQNKWFFPTPEAAEGVDLALIPCNLASICASLLAHSSAPLSPYQQDCLRLHVHGVFTQNFLKEEYPHGYIIGDDVIVVAKCLHALGVAEEIVYEVVKAFDQGEFHLSEEWIPLEAPLQSPGLPPLHTDGAADDLGADDALRVLADPGRADDAESEVSFNHAEDDPEGSQNMLDLLYHIAGEQARRDGYIHRGVECNSCGVHPIQGIRYHCANCFDFDLCESCEAQSVHVKSHVFFKIRIPAPSRGNIKQVTPKWYPGNPNAFLTSLPRHVSKPLLEQTGMDRTEMEAMYEQFKCLAAHFWPADPCKLGVAIDRKGFDAYFLPSMASKTSPANLIYDRIFNFYDTNHDNLIGFDEFIRGLVRLQDKSRAARLRRIFDGYDLDGDGYVDRKDFLRMFRAYYALSKEMSREMISSQDEYGYVEEEIREVVQASQPISAAFGGGTLAGHESRAGQDKHRQANGDLVVSGGPTGVLESDLGAPGDRARAIGNVVVPEQRNPNYRSFRRDPIEDESLLLLPIGSTFGHSRGQDPDEATDDDLTGPDPPLQLYAWPPRRLPETRDVVTALGQEVPLDDITDPVDRSRVLFAQAQRLDDDADRNEAEARTRAVHERWHRRHFYLDQEEGMTRPVGYMEPDDSSSDEGGSASETKGARGKANSPRRPSMQSRSSSKVRFDDSAIDTDFETRSNASSRSVPVNERWGGYELGQAEADIGKDVLYQAVQQGLNELLDKLFKDKEEQWATASASRRDRTRFAREREAFERSLDQPQVVPIPEQAPAEAEAMPQPSSPTAVTGQGTHSDTELGVSGDQEAFREPELAGEQGDSGEHRISGEPVVDEASSDSEAGSTLSYHDPTLPQFRPDEDDADRRPDGVASPSASAANPFAGGLQDATHLLETWRRHDEIDAEAQTRGGYGKLNFTEFCRKMVDDDQDRGMNGTKDTTDGQEKWDSSADLGRLAFVGTWLEMASF